MSVSVSCVPQVVLRIAAYSVLREHMKEHTRSPSDSIQDAEVTLRVSAQCVAASM